MLYNIMSLRNCAAFFFFKYCQTVQPGFVEQFLPHVPQLLCSRSDKHIATLLSQNAAQYSYVLKLEMPPFM